MLHHLFLAPARYALLCVACHFGGCFCSRDSTRSTLYRRDYISWIIYRYQIWSFKLFWTFLGMRCDVPCGACGRAARFLVKEKRPDFKSGASSIGHRMDGLLDQWTRGPPRYLFHVPARSSSWHAMARRTVRCCTSEVTSIWCVQKVHSPYHIPDQ